MNGNSNAKIRLSRLQVFVALGLVLSLLLGTVATLSAEPPPTWQPPEIYKLASKTRLALGDPVRFTITVVNPSKPENQATWRSVRVWDEIDPAFRIDKVEVVPPADEVTITGNIVWVKVNRLKPGESFVVTIDCTLVGPAKPGDVLENKATLRYDDPEGSEQDPIDSNIVKIKVVSRIWLPAIFRQYTR